MTLGLADFTGRWRIDRRIEDRHLNRTGQLHGAAVFTADGDGLHYDETGTLSFPGQPPLEARQTYLWRAGRQGVAVCFADGRAFHSFDLSAPQTSASHDCAPDLYLVRYDFSAWPHWSSDWSVTGPRKDYVMATQYQRA